MPDEVAPNLFKLMVQYMYEAEYDPPLTDPASAIAKERTYKDAYDLEYTYDFPHTCVVTGSKCFKKTLCPHHTCYKHTCEFNCEDFVCYECEDVPGLPSGGADQLLLHASMSAIGDKYYVHGLEALAKEKFERACERYWNTPEFEKAAEYTRV